MNGLPQNIKVIDYQCVSVGVVMSYINNGWSLYGSPFFDNYAGISCQVLIKIKQSYVSGNEEESFSCDNDQEHN